MMIPNVYIVKHTCLRDIMSYSFRYSTCLSFALYRMQPFYNVSLVETQNWVRLACLIINQGTLCLRRIIADKLAEWQLGFKQLLTANKKRLRNSKLLFEDQKQLLLSKDAQDDVIEKCDLTLLILLIGLLVLPAPPCGWHSCNEPEPTDLDTSSDVMRLRFIRNDLFHCVQCAIPQEDFEKRWAKGTEFFNVSKLHRPTWTRSSLVTSTVCSVHVM